ncbi:copper amine oxidase N-terminal domain-containing protein [Natranaerobius trueperi]|uniref:Copper amine oxidase n=1 Tax=Natranaerobius trueperi TaxID=759412 RepID=A0A226C3L3_9FIRM|nr:copper amine oxidase N-terminal domain-containing protein [Natranaerobius trueperi]OWZ85017.1 copper amine oxidase [Natranaerobius trueperi]
MKFKRSFGSTFAVFSLALVTSVSVSAGPAGVDTTNENGTPKDRIGEFTGVVEEISDHPSLDDVQKVFLENDHDQKAHLLVSDSTPILGADEITEDTLITGYYDNMKPITMIYPPQYQAVAITTGELDENKKAHKFNEDLISTDNSLKLNIEEDTKVINNDGEKFEGDLEDRELLVTYDISTRSIPAKTTPEKVVVLFEDRETMNTTYDQKIEATNMKEDISSLDIVVENEIIDTYEPYFTDDMPMVPVREIAETLGYEVTWKNGQIMIGNVASLTIGEKEYNYAKKAPIELIAPELKAGRTFVPLNFFRDVLNLNNAYLLEDQIVIDDGEKME